MVGYLNPKSYNCELLLEKTTIKEVKNPNYPNDAYLVFYTVEDNNYIDLCRGKMVDIFDLYYDSYGKESIQKITWGYGKMNPKLWGIEKKEDKRQKR